MLNKNFFRKLKQDFKNYQIDRRKIISQSNDALHKSKQAIFALHRGEVSEADKILKEAEKIFLDLEKKFRRTEKLRGEGSYLAALEEYAEAKLFFNYLKTGRVGKIKEINIGHETYLGGICDFTGELVRKAVAEATKGNIGEVEKIKQTVELVMKELIEMNLTGYLRNKYDQAKNNLRKMEEMLYQIKLKQ